MIFPGEHGIFGAKVENEFLEDKGRVRKMIRKQLYKKSYIKEIDSLMKDVKVLVFLFNFRIINWTFATSVSIGPDLPLSRSLWRKHCFASTCAKRHATIT
jgi:hypothetical protein